MAKLLPDDFREFLKLCNRKRVRYLLIGGYAVGYHGYVRATADLDVWIEISEENAAKMVDVVTLFGFTFLMASLQACERLPLPSLSP